MEGTTHNNSYSHVLSTNCYIFFCIKYLFSCNVMRRCRYSIRTSCECYNSERH
uniref:Uncharacterized protein n=1 Tax=Solanum lycopersicum TaxID=4081 RepID=A0A3Q7GEW1_SOLLC